MVNVAQAHGAEVKLFGVCVTSLTGQKGTLLACYAASLDRREIVAIPTL
jgi:hypothetical protein